ncbi:MAG: DeoR/GlpR transcriptional regulator [Lachnospiraceae bacterium]|nr:DeoR/GlpR transcriptional regulator [Lachnospiraceae bacterium]
MTKRTNRILELLTNENKMEVSLIAETLGVSQVTIRKDLDELEKKGIIEREHGFAVLRSMDDLNGRIAYHYESKKKIANKASALVKNGDTLMIESGSCCALLAESLAADKKDLTIITNSAYIANYIRGKSNFQIILLGGTYQQDAQVMVGPMVRQCAENFCVDQFFIGTDGYSFRTGFTNCDQMRAQAVRDMARQAEKVIVLTESEKFIKHGIVPLNLRGQIQMVITDQMIDPGTSAELEHQGITVTTV